MKRYLVELEAGEREALAAMTRKGSHRSQKVINALVLLNCDEGEFNERRTTGGEIAGVLRISARRVDRVKKRFVEDAVNIRLTRVKEMEAITAIHDHVTVIQAGYLIVATA